MVSKHKPMELKALHKLLWRSSMEEKNNRKKKEFILKRFAPYIGKKKYLLNLALIFSGASAILGILPLVYI